MLASNIAEFMQKYSQIIRNELRLIQNEKTKETWYLNLEHYSELSVSDIKDISVACNVARGKLIRIK